MDKNGYFVHMIKNSIRSVPTPFAKKRRKPHKNVRKTRMRSQCRSKSLGGRAGGSEEGPGGGCEGRFWGRGSIDPRQIRATDPQWHKSGQVGRSRCYVRTFYNNVNLRKWKFFIFVMLTNQSKLIYLGFYIAVFNTVTFKLSTPK